MNEQLKIIISAVTENFKKGVQDAQKEIKSFKEQVKEASKNVDEDIGKMGESVANGAKVMAAGLAGAAATIVGIVNSTEEYRNAQAQLKTAFEAAGSSADVAKETYNDLYRVLGDSGQATEAAQHLAKLTTEEKALSEWTDICQGVYATFGASLPIESLTEAVNHSAKLGEVQGSLADALEWSGISVDAFNEQLASCNSESEKEKLIRETLNGIYSDASAKYEENNADILAQRDAQAKLDEALAQLGTTLAPIVAKFTELASVVLADLIPKLQETFNWIQENKVMLGIIAGVIGTVVTAIGLYNAVTAIKAAMDAAQVTTIWGLVSAHLAQAAAAMAALAPYILIVAAIAAVIAIIVLCIKHWDKISEAAGKAWDWIKQTWEKVANWFNEKVIQPIVNFFSNLWSKITSIVTNIKDGVVNTFTNLKNSIANVATGIWNSITSTFNKITSAMSKPIEKARDLIKGIVDKIKGFFKFEWSLPKLKVPKFSITPSGWSVGDLLKGVIPKLGITWNARGGVFDKPTVFGYGNSLQGIGENGAEAVVPLENNLEWLDKLASMLSEKIGTGKPIVLQVDGRTFAKISADSINEYTRQTGTFPLKLV